MSRVPVGHWRAIHDIDGVQAYIEEDGITTVDIHKFIVTDDFVYGVMGGDYYELHANDDKFFVYDLANNVVSKFDDGREYIGFLKANGLGTNPEYKDFDYYYAQYWGGWRFWLLP